MGGSALVTRDGEIIGIEDGVMPVIGFVLPVDRVELKGNWDVMGLRGTGSYDFDVPEQFVDAGSTWWIFPPAIAPSVSGGPLYGLGAVVVGTISSVAWAIGVAQRALDEVAAIARDGRTRLGSDPLAEQMIFQRGLGLHTTAVEGARVLAKDSYTAAMKAVADGVPDDVFHEHIRATKAVATYVTEVAKAATTFAWESSGSAGIRNPSVLQRCFRDMYVGAGHQVFDQRNYIEVAKATLELDVAGF
jgi:alkylation response protein AidB-like acyl-CoA dehydrogenase